MSPDVHKRSHKDVLKTKKHTQSFDLQSFPKSAGSPRSVSISKGEEP